MGASLLSLVSVLGVPLVVIGGLSWLVALLLQLWYLLVSLNLVGALHHILRLERTSIVAGGLVRSISLSSALFFGLLLVWLLWMRVEAPSLRWCSGFWEVYDDRIEFMAGADALRLDLSLLAGDVTGAG